MIHSPHLGPTLNTYPAVTYVFFIVGEYCQSTASFGGSRKPAHDFNVNHSATLNYILATAFNLRKEAGKCI